MFHNSVPAQWLPLGGDISPMNEGFFMNESRIEETKCDPASGKGVTEIIPDDPQVKFPDAQVEKLEPPAAISKECCGWTAEEEEIMRQIKEEEEDEIMREVAEEEEEYWRTHGYDD